MEAICHLNGFRCALPSTFGVGAGSIPDDDLDAGVCAQPVGEHLGRAIIEQVDRPMGFQVEQQCPVPPLFLSQPDVIDTQHSRTALFAFLGKVMEQAEQRIGADGYASLARQASPTLTTRLQRERGQQVGRVARAPGVVRQYAIEALSEDLTWAIWHIAEPPSAVNSETHSMPAPWQIEWAPEITAVLTSTQRATLRAWNCLASRFRDKHQVPVVLDDDQHDLPMV
jgi:hypothetical protein